MGKLIKLQVVNTSLTALRTCAFLAEVTIVSMGYSHRFWYVCVCVCVCVVRWLTFPIKRIFS